MAHAVRMSTKGMPVIGDHMVMRAAFTGRAAAYAVLVAARRSTAGLTVARGTLRRAGIFLVGIARITVPPHLCDLDLGGRRFLPAFFAGVAAPAAGPAGAGASASAGRHFEIASKAFHLDFQLHFVHDLDILRNVQRIHQRVLRVRVSAHRAAPDLGRALTVGAFDPLPLGNVRQFLGQKSPG